MNPPGHIPSMAEKATEIAYVEYKIPAKELRKIAEASIYSNLDCKSKCLFNTFIMNSFYFIS